MSEQQQQQPGVKAPKIAAPARRRKAADETVVQGQPVDTMREVGEALGRVTVAYGPYEQQFDLAGKTVGYARENLAHIFNIPQDALPVVAGEPVTDVNRVLQAHERLEFMKDAGEKG